LRQDQASRDFQASSIYQSMGPAPPAPFLWSASILCPRTIWHFGL